MKLAQPGEKTTCPMCKGKGTVPVVDKSPANGHPKPCPTCQGRKWVLAASQQEVAS